MCDENSKITIEIMNKRGQEIFDELKNVLDKKDKEIDRLNNIIDELEKDIRNNMADYDKLYEEQDEQEYLDKYFALKIELDKLKELKEGKECRY